MKDPSVTAALPLRDFQRLVVGCIWPSEAYWRAYELAAVREQQLAPPILEIGCGDGGFAELAGLRIEVAVELNPRAAARAARRTETYGQVCASDILAFDVGRERFATVFANSVLEHIPDVEGVLAKACRCLRPGGNLVTTVPLASMNEHLVFRARWYAEFRRRQLVHRNLWPKERWELALRSAGFERVEWTPTLSAASCRRWDAVDLIGSAGVGRLRLGTILRRSAQSLFPEGIRTRTGELCARALHRRYHRHRQTGFCAALLVARKL